MAKQREAVYERLRAGYAQAEIARDLRISRQAVYHHVRQLREQGRDMRPRGPRPRRNWSYEDLQKIIRMYRDGYDVWEMTTVFKRTYNCLCQMVQSLIREGVLQRRRPQDVTQRRLVRMALSLRKDGKHNDEIDAILNKGPNYSSNLFSKLRKIGVRVPPSPYRTGRGGKR